MVYSYCMSSEWVATGSGPVVEVAPVRAMHDGAGSRCFDIALQRSQCRVNVDILQVVLVD